MNKRGTYRKGMNQDFRMTGFEISRTKKDVPYLKVIFTDSGQKRNFYWFGFYKTGGFVDKKFVEGVEAAKADNKRLMQDIKSIVASVAGQDAVDTAMKLSEPKGWEAFLNVMKETLPSNFKSKNVDVFLRYQWKPNEDQDRTFLEIPDSSKHGAFICEGTTGEYNKFEDEDTGVKYLNQKLQAHPFSREGWWVVSHYNNAQGVVTKEEGAPRPTPKATPPVTPLDDILGDDDDLPF